MLSLIERDPRKRADEADSDRSIGPTDGPNVHVLIIPYRDSSGAWKAFVRYLRGDGGPSRDGIEPGASGAYVDGAPGTTPAPALERERTHGLFGRHERVPSAHRERETGVATRERAESADRWWKEVEVDRGVALDDCRPDGQPSADTASRTAS